MEIGFVVMNKCTRTYRGPEGCNLLAGEVAPSAERVIAISGCVSEEALDNGSVFTTQRL
jgi:hypothetical protein